MVSKKTDSRTQKSGSNVLKINDFKFLKNKFILSKYLISDSNERRFMVIGTPPYIFTNSLKLFLSITCPSA